MLLGQGKAAMSHQSTCSVTVMAGQNTETSSNHTQAQTDGLVSKVQKQATIHAQPQAQAEVACSVF